MGYKAKFSPQFSRSKCKPSPLLFLPWDSVGGVGQGGFRILHKSGIDSLALGALQGWPSGLGCWDGWRHGWSAWAVASSGAGGGRRSYAVIFCALPLSSPLSPSLPIQIVGSLGAGGGAGSGVWLGAGSAWAQAFPVPWAG